MASSNNINVFNVKDYGALGNGRTDDTTAINETIAAAKTQYGGIIYFPHGVYSYSTQLSVENCIGLTFRGEYDPTGMSTDIPSSDFQSQHTMPTTLMYTGSGVITAMTFKNSEGIRFENLCLSWDSSSFAGYLMDWTGSTNVGMSQCFVQCVYGAIQTSPAALLKIDECFLFDCQRCWFCGGQYSVIGRLGAGDASKASNIQFMECSFAEYAKISILNPDRCWLFQSCHWEPNSSNNAGAIGFNDGLPSQCLSVIGCYLCDTGEGSTGPWIGLISGCQATLISGCSFTSPSLSANIGVLSNGIQGLVVSACLFGASSKYAAQYTPTAIDFGTTTGHKEFNWFGNAYSTDLTRPINGAPPTGSLIN